jgi:hypothetical protein
MKRHGTRPVTHPWKRGATFRIAREQRLRAAKVARIVRGVVAERKSVDGVEHSGFPGSAA